MVSDYVVLILLALVVSGAATLVLFVLVRAAKVSRISLFSYFYPLTLLFAGVSAVTSPRDFTTMWVVAADLERSPVAAWVTRIVSVILLSGAAVEILRAILSKNIALSGSRPLVIAQWILVITGLFSPALLSANPYFEYTNIYAPLYCFAAISLSDLDAARAIRLARDGMLAFVLIGLLLIPVVPKLVLNTTYEAGWIPGLPRLAGLATHEVSLGTMTTILGVTLLSFPYRSRLANNLAWVVTISALILSQSKNAWATSLVIYATYALYDYRRGIHRSGLKWGRGLVTIGLPIIMALVAVGLSAVMFTGLLDQIDVFFHTRAGIRMLSFSGRDVIWEEAMRAWRSDPWFGYGLPLFGPEHRAIIGMPYAVHGHNQFFDTLGRSGLVGFSGLLIYLGVVCRRALKMAIATNGLSIALLLSLAIRAVTEVPISVGNFGYELLPYLMLLIVISRRDPAVLGAYRQTVLAARKQPSRARARNVAVNKVADASDSGRTT